MNYDNLSPLNSLRLITGDLSINANAHLISLEGFHNLQKIGRRLYIQYNPLLTSLNGLQGLRSIGTDLIIEDGNGRRMKDKGAKAALEVWYTKRRKSK